MFNIEHYEILVIGSGESGKHLTWNLAQAGHRDAAASLGPCGSTRGVS